MLGFAPIHLMIGNVLAILWLVLPLATWLFRKRLPWIKGRGSRWFVACLVLGSILDLGMVLATEMELRSGWEKYDLDRNGELSEPELIPEAREAMRRWTTDTGRSFALILVIPLILAWTSVNFAILAFLGWLWARIGAATEKGEGGDKRVKAGLPYEPPRWR